MKKGALILAMILIASSFGYNSAAQEVWFKLPYKPAAGVQGKYIYFVGGYNSDDRASDLMGGNDEAVNLFLGDKAGDMEIAYRDGTSDRIPLIFGYTIWFKSHWSEGGAPFGSAAAESDMTRLLEETLHLQGAFESEDRLVMKVEIQNKPIKEITLTDNPAKRGTPLFEGGYLLKSDLKKNLSGGRSVNTSDPFFASHTILSTNPEVDEADMAKLRERLYTFEKDFEHVPEFSFPSGYRHPKVSFSGNSYANILTRVYHDNLEDIELNKMEDNGIINESSRYAPSWLYGGFGTWVPDAHTYYGSMYSRNRGLGILSLLDLKRQSNQSVYALNYMLMYYPDNGLEINGKPIPGHWSMIPNKPMEFSKMWVAMGGWKSRYTEERFGEGFENLGNMEPDGHGMTMMDIANVWISNGAPVEWVDENWREVAEAVNFIAWAMENTDISFNENGLMYGESEGGMMDHTMFNNIPCYLGLRMYTLMAEKAGRTQEAAAWTKLADELERAILENFRDNNMWDLSKSGFHHDPSMPFMADYVGYDVFYDAPCDWYNRSNSTYETDKERYLKDTYTGTRGLAFDHNMITQTSLLLDKAEDYDKFVTNLARLCYAPRLPEPCLVPEAANYSKEQGLFRRQGDLGNYSAQNETLRTILLVAGASQEKNGTVKLMPRLPRGWSADIADLTIRGGDGNAKISYQTAYPVDNTQTLRFTVWERGNIDRLEFRAGPFTVNEVTVDGKVYNTELVGDSRWVWLTVDGIKDGTEYIIEVK